MKNKRGRKRIITIAVLVVLAAIISFVIFMFMYRESQNKINRIMTKSEKEKKYREQEKNKNIKKKNSGKAGDKDAPKIIDFTITTKVINYEKKIFPEIKMKLEDISGIYAVKIHFIRLEKEIGIIQENINKKSKSVSFSKIIGSDIVLKDLKLFRDYEGAELTLNIEVIDNNLNVAKKEIKGIKIADNIKPEIPEFLWTFKSRSKGLDVIEFTKEKENTFLFKTVKDLPELEENKIKEYRYSVTDEEKKEIEKGIIEPTEENVYAIKIKSKNDGKFKIALRAYDMSGNFSEKELKFGVDTMEPFVKVDILEGQKFYVGDIVTIKIDAIDTLSGVYRYRIAGSKQELLRGNWEFIEKNVKCQLPEKEGIYDIWCEVQDRAMNRSAPANIAYALVRDSSLKIKSTSQEMKTKERVLRINKDSYKKGKVEIESAEER